MEEATLIVYLRAPQHKQEEELKACSLYKYKGGWFKTGWQQETVKRIDL